MKKSIAIFLVLLYASTALGTVIDFHYCKGNLARISILNYGGISGCCCYPKNMPEDCCKDQIQFEKADTHETVQQVALLYYLSIPAKPHVGNNYHITPFQNGYTSRLMNESVSRTCSELIYLLDGVLRI
ncbi:MAG TPA: hypothetical protein VFO70_10840 [Chitinophagaceae bacterium]|nr:hypothetical protein [Chitinophagaceae bacterium]